MGDLYLNNAFGWEAEPLAKVAITQLRVALKISDTECPGKQLAKNSAGRIWTNMAKFAGYIPVINVIVGTVIVGFALNANSVFAGNEYRPNNRAWWMRRGIATICTGPLLIIVDLIKFLYDLSVAAEYKTANEALIDRFNTGHEHSRPPYPGHPVRCIGVGVAHAGILPPHG